MRKADTDKSQKKSKFFLSIQADFFFLCLFSCIVWVHFFCFCPTLVFVAKLMESKIESLCFLPAKMGHVTRGHWIVIDLRRTMFLSLPQNAAAKNNKSEWPKTMGSVLWPVQRSFSQMAGHQDILRWTGNIYLLMQPLKHYDTWRLHSGNLY